MANSTDDLALLIRARHPLITIEMAEERRAIEMVLSSVRALSIPASIWDLIEGLRQADVTAGNVVAGTRTHTSLAQVVAVR